MTRPKPVEILLDQTTSPWPCWIECSCLSLARVFLPCWALGGPNFSTQTHRPTPACRTTSQTQGRPQSKVSTSPCTGRSRALGFEANRFSRLGPLGTWRSRSLRRATTVTTPSSGTSLSLTPWHGWPRAHPKYLGNRGQRLSLRAKPAVAGLRPSGDCQGVEEPCPQKQDAPAKHVSLPLALRFPFRFHLSLFQSHGADLPSRLGGGGLLYFCAAS